MKVLILLFISLSASASCPDLQGKYAHCLGETGDIMAYYGLEITKSTSPAGIYSYDLSYQQSDVLLFSKFVTDGQSRVSSEPSPIGAVKTFTTASCEAGALVVVEQVSVPSGLLVENRREFRRSGDSVTIHTKASVLGKPLEDVLTCR